MKTAPILLAALLCVGGILSPGPARGQSAGDLDLIASCLVDAKDSPLACLGRIQKPCLEEPGGETTLGAMRCAEREEEVWDARAALARIAVREKLSTSRRALFDEAAVAWEGYRLKACQYESALYEGGSLAKVVLADCFLRESAERAIELEAEDAALRGARE